MRQLQMYEVTRTVGEARKVSEVFEMNWCDIYHVGYYSDMAYDLFREIFTGMVEVVDFPFCPPIYLWDNANVVLRAPDGEVCIYIPDTIGFNIGRCYTERMKGLQKHFGLLKGLPNHFAFRELSPEAEALLCYECGDEGGDLAKQIKGLKGMPFSNPIKVEALRCIYQEIMDTCHNPSFSVIERQKRSAELRQMARGALRNG